LPARVRGLELDHLADVLENIWNDDRSFAPGGGATGFLVVHALLTAVSLLFGTAIGVLGYRGLRHRTDAPTIERV
jgi:hypothetical protein